MKLNLLVVVMSFFYFKCFAQVQGCRDPLASNYNAAATISDCSCTYNTASITASSKYLIPTSPANLEETSGLILIGNKIYTHNDSGGDAAIYELDTITGSGAIIRTINITNATNVDWEDITQNDTHLFIGDFGNNVDGARMNLIIYKIAKSELAVSNNIIAEIINFTYSNQTQPPTAVAANTTNFDCEAMIATNDSIYLFTKQWTALQTSLYKMPVVAGSYVASLKSTWAANTLVTGATLTKNKNAVVLTAYNKTGGEQIILLYGFTQNNFLDCTKRNLTLNEGSITNFHQIEAITNIDDKQFFISNEKSVITYPIIGAITTTAKLRKIDLTSFLQPWYTVLPIRFTNFTALRNNKFVNIFFSIEAAAANTKYEIQTSTNGIDFFSIKEIYGNGNNFNYEIMLQSNNNFFRIVAIADEQKRHFSNIVKVLADKNVFNIFPNPVKDKLYLSTVGFGSKPLCLKIFNAEGKFVLDNKKNNIGGFISVMQLAAGVYTVVVNDGIKEYSEKFVKE